MKKWTIFIYANGNNEFEPEMYQNLLDAEKIGSNGDIDIVVQLGRISRQLVKILRPNEDIPLSESQWDGVRRYYVKYKSLELIKDFERLNMADPRVLYDFLKWGIDNHPAENYMLLMGGHCFEYLGIMNDYSGELPYIMGFPEMCKALNLIKKNIGQSMDVLVLDTCYINNIEILYELGRDKDHGVKNVLTYIEYGPISGIPFGNLLTSLQKNIIKHNHHELLFEMVKELEFDLIAFKIKSKKLERIKRNTNDLAQALLENTTRINKSLLEIVSDTNSDEPWSHLVNMLQRNIKDLIINAKRITNQNSLLVNIAHKKATTKLAENYFKLSFVHNNKWRLLIGDQHQQEGLLQKPIQLKTTILPLQALVSLVSVMNPNGSEEEINKILQNLFAYKKWDKYTNYKIK